ncbi:expressed unknown protein [Seminavis robusta]|uniref:Uncharacterized protein n=1 Tax=Seminavis robusta TaxID=568900 RepID=A0A9N8EUJ7_9STRA|nr:expressed unknown protein [Seminavis robusta]|eukprot:Sro1992_g309850.1 n/a (239) ;mRNA; f:9257-10079
MSGRAAKRQRRGQPKEDKEDPPITFEAFSTTEEFVKSQGANLQDALNLTDDHAAFFAKLQIKTLQKQGMHQIASYKKACDKADYSVEEMLGDAEQLIAQKRAELEEFTAKKMSLGSLRSSIQQTRVILEIGETVATNTNTAVAEPANSDDNNKPPLMLLLEFSVGDNAALRLVNSFLDPYSLYQWGRVVVEVESANGTENQPELSAAREIGMAIFNHTVLPKPLLGNERMSCFKEGCR